MALLLPMQVRAQSTNATVAAPDVATNEGGEAQETEAETLQERLTEREDKRRPIDPAQIELAGRVLTIGGEFEQLLDYHNSRASDQAAVREQPGSLSRELELEAFYSFGPAFSLFAQVRVGAMENLSAPGTTGRNEHYFERGEMWLYSEDIAGSGIDLDVGRLHFEDDRRWWWDEDLDAVRVTRGSGNFEISLALANERAPSRTDHGRVEPELDGVQHLIAEASWDWHPNHTLQLFALNQNDRSGVKIPGQRIQADREDPSDARLTWFGARAIGGFGVGRGGILGYWFDWAQVHGRERVAEYEALDTRYSEVDAINQREVRGGAFDVGINWLLPFAVEPRLFAGYAYGSGDADPADGVDRAFRQSGLQSNEAGFGGVEHYTQYGFLLDPELSNLHIQTFGAGISVWRSSSLDLVWHRYRLDRPATELRGTDFEIELDGKGRALGSGVDIVLGLEEWERFELDCIVSVFHAADAFGVRKDQRNYGALLGLRVAF